MTSFVKQYLLTLIIGLAVGGLISFLTMLNGGCALPVPASWIAPPAAQTIFPEETNSVSLPFSLAPISGYTLVAGQIKNCDGVFILDTGGRISIASENYRSKIGITKTFFRSAVVGRSKYRFLVVPELRFSHAPSLLMKDVTMVAMDMENASRVCGLQIDGTIGMDVIQHHILEIDYGRGLAIIHRNQDKIDNTTLVPLPIPRDRHDEIRPVVVATFGTNDVPALLDTGSFDAISIPDHVFQATGLELLDPKDTLRGLGVGTPIEKSRVGRIRAISVGPITLRNVQAVIIPDASGRGDTVIGAPILRQFRIVFTPNDGKVLVSGPKIVENSAITPALMKIVEEAYANTFSGNSH